MSKPARSRKAEKLDAVIIERGMRAREVRQLSIPELARRDPLVFNRYVLRDELTNKKIQIAPMHGEWQDFISANDNALIIGHLESGKSQQITVGRVLWEIGHNPDIRIVILSKTSTIAAKFLSSIKKYIETSEEYRRVFPHIKPGGIWTDSAITVERPGFGKDFTVQCVGLGGAPQGARVDLLVMDDILDFENTRTGEQRVKVYQFLKSDLFGRARRIWGLANAYHPRDAFHVLEKEGWPLKRFPVIDKLTGVSNWIARFTQELIDKLRFKLGPLEFARKMLCEARDDGDSRFKREWIELALRRGYGKVIGLGVDKPWPPGYKCVFGVDLNVQQHDGADLACITALIIHPNEDRELLDIESGRWGGPDTFKRVLAMARRWNPHVILVENNGAQDFFLQFTSERTALPMLPYTTGATKASPEFGVESIGVEMLHGKWILPSAAGQGELVGASQEITELIEEMLFYTPAKHTGDRLMSLFLAREAIHHTMPKVESGTLDTLRR